MTTGIHFLLTYRCNFECDHCFLYCGPDARGTFTIEQIKTVLGEAGKIGTVTSIFFEGGEPLLYYPLLKESIRLAHDMGFDTGVVTNAYMATSVEDAALWLKPLFEAGLSRISISDDPFHSDREDSPGKLALTAARDLGFTASPIHIDGPTVEKEKSGTGEKGAPVIGGGTLFKGRAAEKLTLGLPRKNRLEFDECKREELVSPKRVHVDPFGNVHICQGISMGNMWKTPLSTLVSEYDGSKHPVVSCLLKGGPALLAETYEVCGDERFVDECHLCFAARKALVRRFPEYLTPGQVYGIKE